MTLAPLFFILAALVLLGLLAYAVRPIAKRVSLTRLRFRGPLRAAPFLPTAPDSSIACSPLTLSFWNAEACAHFGNAFASERTQIAIRYLDQLESDYETLLGGFPHSSGDVA